MKEGGARPYWHVDLKWVFGLLLLAVLTATLILFFLTQVTKRENAVHLGSLALATFFSREEGLDGSSSIEELKAELADQPGEVITPLPDIPSITITRSDLETLSPREVRLKIFRQVVEPLYDHGLEGAARQFSDDPAVIEQQVGDAFYLQVFTKTFHDKVQNFFMIGLLVSLLLMAGFIYFSFGWARLGNPGILLLLIGFPGLLVGLLMRYPPQDGDGGPFKYIPPEVGTGLGGQLLLSSGSVAVIGLLMVVTAVIGSIISRHRRAV